LRAESVETKPMFEWASGAAWYATQTIAFIFVTTTVTS
jgi:hypothetical protein